jgi:hypothetical protein
MFDRWKKNVNEMIGRKQRPTRTIAAVVEIILYSSNKRSFDEKTNSRVWPGQNTHLVNDSGANASDE